MRFLIIFFVLFNFQSFALTLKAQDSTIRNKTQLSRIVKNVKEDDLISTLRDFVRCCRPSRMAGTSGHEMVSKWLVDEIKKRDNTNSGLTFVDDFIPNTEEAIKKFQDNFQKEIVGRYEEKDPVYKKWNDYTKSMIQKIESLKTVTGKNVIWEKKGSKFPNEVIMLGAHYDTIAFNKETLVIDESAVQPGADNNGTGVVALLEMINLFSKIQLEKTIRIVFFDMQELGELGSRAFVSKYLESLKKENFVGFMNVMMLGFDTKTSDKIKKIGNFKAYIREGHGEFPDSDKSLFDMINRAGSRVNSSFKFTPLGKAFSPGDHLPFWEAGLPAVTFTQDFENDYNEKRNHTSNDFVETLNFKTYHKAFLYLAAGVLAQNFEIK